MTIMEKLSEFFSGRSGDKQEPLPAQDSVSDAPKEKSGLSLGEFVLEGVEDDESVAVILAVVSDYTDIPMNELKIASVRAIQ